MIHLLPTLNNNLKQQTQPCKSSQESLIYTRTREKTKKEENHQIHKRFPMGNGFITKSKKKVPLATNISFRIRHTESIKNFEKLESTWELVLELFDKRGLFDEPFELGSAKGLEFRNISVVSRRASYGESKSWRGWSCAMKIFGFEEQRRRARTEQSGLYHRIHTHTDTSISRISHTNTRLRALRGRYTYIPKTAVHDWQSG